MKILFISRKFYPDIIGGGQISAFYIAKAAKMAGHETYVCTFTDNKETFEEELQGIKIFRIPIPKLKFSKILSNMDYMYFQMAKISSKIIEKINPDIIHLLNFESIPLSSIYYKKKYNIPIVATVNGPLFGCFTQNGLDYKNKTCLKCEVLKRYKCSTSKWGFLKGTFYYFYSLWYIKMLKRSYKYVDKFFIVSEAMRPIMKNMCVPNKKLTVVHNPVEIKKKIKTDLKKRLNIQGKKVILYAGRLSKEKGVQHTIKALPYVKNAVFLVVGEKKGYYDELVKLTKDLKVEEKVIFTGFVHPDNMPEYYSIADVAVLVEEFYESLSRFLLEAASFGVPIIANDVGGNKEIVQDNKNGFIVRKNVAALSKNIKKIFEKKKFELEFRKKGIEYFEKKFSMKKISEKLDKEYIKIIN